MDKLTALLEEHQYDPNRYSCYCDTSVELYRSSHRAHLAEMLKPLLAEVWQDGCDTRDRSEFEPTDLTNPYETEQ